MSRLCGAGVLPFCRTERGDVLFLLAKERYVPHWRGSSRWSGFEGGVKGEESAAQNAVREFCEESICVLETNHEELETEFLQNNYAMRVNILTESRKPACSMQSLHATFVKEFRHDPDLPTRFEERRKDLMALQQASESLAMFTEALPQNIYPFLREGHAVLLDKRYTVYAVTGVNVENGVFKITLSLTPDGGYTIKKKMITYMLTESIMPLANAYKTWFSLR